MQSPSIGIGFAGRIEWQVVNQDGSIRQQGRCRNLITDTGLDHIGNYGFCALRNVGGNTTGSNADMKSFCAVGTGSTAPANTDQSLVAEVARTSTLYQNGEVSEPSAGFFNHKTFHEFDFGQATGNLTEYGFAPTSTAFLSIRELFRDGTGTPVVITVASDEKLRIIHTLEVTISPTATTAGSFDITGIGTITGSYLFNKAGATPPNFLGNSDAFGGAGVSAILRGGNINAHINTDAPPSPYTYDSAPGAVATDFAKALTTSYTAGSYARTYSVTLATNEANFEHKWYSLQKAVTSDDRGSWAFILDAASYYTKDNQHTLALDLCRFTWARA